MAAGVAMNKTFPLSSGPLLTSIIHENFQPKQQDARAENFVTIKFPIKRFLYCFESNNEISENQCG